MNKDTELGLLVVWLMPAAIFAFVCLCITVFGEISRWLFNDDVKWSHLDFPSLTELLLFGTMIALWPLSAIVIPIVIAILETRWVKRWRKNRKSTT